MTFQRTIVALLILMISGLAGPSTSTGNWQPSLRTVKAFVEGYVFAEAVLHRLEDAEHTPSNADAGKAFRRELCLRRSRCGLEKAQSTTPFKWNAGTRTSVIGLNSVKLDKYTVSASYTLVADGVFCDYDPVKKKADIGSNFLERD